ncbi:MAG: hypothetical protein JOZ40_20390, partial [Methylobacteriaceae bacterium]|nr:hypothetical protein [Methylobacteriaceae bacterium]
MVVFGDASRLLCPRRSLGALAAELAAIEGESPGITTHGRLVGIFIEAAEVAQGLADAEFEAAAQDCPSPARESSARLLMALAQGIRRSWENGLWAPRSGAALLALRKLAALDLPDEVLCARPEGFAFYAVYPEAYLRAAADLTADSARVVGIRSIGLGLAALVAARLSASPPVSIRPIGHPFDRRLSIRDDLADAILRDEPGAFAIVDEGPGLSGSSFGAVADFLEEHGVSRRRIHFFPSHDGDPGPQVKTRHRHRWRNAPRHTIGFDDLALRPQQPWQGLRAWVADLAETAPASLDDISGGRWRALRYRQEADWPPAHVQQERRKFLLRGEAGGTLLVKFAGLGRYGERKLERAHALSEAGFIPTVVAYRHGFLVEQWVADSRPPDFVRLDRDTLIVRLADYLGFRARRFRAEAGEGAAPAELAAMLRQNALERLGSGALAACERIGQELRQLEGRIRRVATDNRLHVWEWLEGADGSLLKTDAVDHCEAHDLIGCQDIAWDVAGAAVELELSADERQELRLRTQFTARHPVTAELMACLTPYYLAFQLGYYVMAADALACMPDE